MSGDADGYAGSRGPARFRSSRNNSCAERTPHRCAPSCLKTVHLSQIVSTRSSAGAVFEKSIRADRYILLFQISEMEFLWMLPKSCLSSCAKQHGVTPPSG